MIDRIQECKYILIQHLQETFLLEFITTRIPVNQFYTISYVTKELRSTRQAISLIVDECENEGWLNIHRRANKVKFQASEKLYESWRDYVYARTNIMTSEERNDWISMLTLYKNLNEKY